MNQASGGKPRVRCPGCERVFEFDEDNRGYATRCPKCEMEFMIPDEGMDGIPLDLTDEEAVLAINCPHCGTQYVLPEEYRGEVADCAECHGVFTIPDVADAEAIPGDAQRDAEEQLSQDLPNEAPSPSTSDLRRTATVFLSRKEVMDKAAQGRSDGADRLARPSGIRHQGQPVSEESADSDSGGTRVARGVIELSTDPVFEPAHARAVRRSDLPEWMPPLEFEKREKIVEYEEGGEPSLLAHKVVTIIPVLLIPVAAVLAALVHPAMAGAFCFVLGLFFWGLHALKLLPPLGRKVIVLTNFRVIMADPREVIDIDLL